MRCVVQRVKRASVKVNHEIIGEIGNGLLVFLGIGQADNDKDVEWIIDKILGLRIFEDAEGKMNLSITDVDGAVLLVSQFTLYGDCRKGRRPSFSDAALPETAKAQFDQIVAGFRAKITKVETGEFQADMDVELINDGPVTLLLDSKKNF